MCNSQSVTSGSTGEPARRCGCIPATQHSPSSTLLLGLSQMTDALRGSMQTHGRAGPLAFRARFLPLLARLTHLEHPLCVPWRRQGEAAIRAGCLEEEASGQSLEGWEGPACGDGRAVGRSSRVTGEECQMLTLMTPQQLGLQTPHTHAGGTGHPCTAGISRREVRYAPRAPVLRESGNDMLLVVSLCNYSSGGRKFPLYSLHILEAREDTHPDHVLSSNPSATAYHLQVWASEPEFPCL